MTLIEDMDTGERHTRVAAGEASIIGVVCDWLKRFHDSDPASSDE